MSNSLTVQRARPEDLATLWRWCTETARQMVYPSFFCSGEWLQAVAAQSEHDAVAVFVVAAESGTVAILPLQKKSNFLGGEDYRMLGADFYPDPLGLIAAPEHLEAATNALKTYFHESSFWDRITLDWLLEDEIARWGVGASRQTVEPYRVLPASFDELLKEFKKKKRYNLRSAQKRFMDEGGELIWSESLDSRRNLLEALFSLHGKRADERALDSSFMGDRVESLHRNLVESSSSVRLYGLRFQGKIVAVIYGFEHAGCFFYYQVAHDPDYGNYSPGSVLLYLVIEDSCSRGLKEFNFLQGNESYKKIWASQARTLYKGVLVNDNWRASVLQRIEASKKRGKAYLKKAKGKLQREY